MRKFLIIPCLAVLALAACGNGGNGDIDVASKKSAKDSSAGASADGTDPKFSGKGSKNFCEYLLELKKNEGDLTLAGDNSEKDKERAKNALKVLDDLQNKAPAEIKDDVVLVVKQIRPFFESAAKGEKYNLDATNKPTAAETKEYAAAGARLEAYSGNVCGIKSETTTTVP